MLEFFFKPLGGDMSLEVQGLRLCNARGMGSIPGPETKIPHVSWYS